MFVPFGFIFKKAANTAQLLDVKRKQFRKVLDEQKRQFREQSILQAKVAQNKNIINMILDNMPEANKVIITTDDKSKDMITNLSYSDELSDYKIDIDGLNYKFRYKEIEL